MIRMPCKTRASVGYIISALSPKTGIWRLTDNCPTKTEDKMEDGGQGWGGGGFNEVAEPNFQLSAIISR